jgi:tetratricopeptide (TPR) repeat protein
VFVVIGGTVAFALSRGGSSSSTPVAAVAPTPAPGSAAPSTILPSDPAAPDVAAADPAKAEPARAAADTARAPAPAADTRAAAPAPAAATRSPASRRSDVHAAAEPRVPTPRRPEPSFPVPGSEPTRRPPSLGTTGTTATPTPARPTAPTLTDGPKDPYDDSPAEGAAPEKKAEFFANLGGQQLSGGDTVGAAASFKKALELDAKNVAAVMGMGEIALRQGLFGDAIAHLSRAAKLAPKSSKVLTLLGEAYLNSGNNTQAAAQFKKALQIDPDNARARDGYNEASSRVAPPEDDQ